MKKKDVEQLLASGIITPEQAVAITDKFRLNESRGWHWLLVCFSALAGGLIVAGVVMLISANWYNIPPLVKMINAMLLLLACWVGWVWQREHRPVVAEVLGFCGAGMWLSCIALYGQIFQLQNPFVEGCTLFFAGIALLPFICRQRFLIWVVVAMSFVELAVLSEGTSSPLNFEHFIPEWDAKYLGFAMPLLGAIWWGLAEKWRISSERWTSYSWVAPVLLLVWVSVSQAIMYLGGISLCSLDVVCVVLMSLVPVVLVLLKPRGTRWLPWLGMTALWSLPIAVYFLLHRVVIEMGVSGMLGTFDSVDVHGIIPRWIFRFILIFVYFLLALLVMFSGVRAQRMSWINIGSLMVVYTAIALVTDVLRSYTFSGLVLVISGLIMLGLGILLEKSRRRLIRSVKNTQPSLPQA